MAETLWAPWRMDYILSEKPSRCVFCEAVEAGEPHREENLLLHFGDLTVVMMNRFPYTHAHLMVMPKRHIARLDELTPAEHDEFFSLLVTAQVQLEKTLHPQGFNVGINLGEAAGAGIKDHLHVHIVPRWRGDTNFMPLLADTKVMPEHLSETYRQLQPYFLRLQDKS